MDLLLMKRKSTRNRIYGVSWDGGESPALTRTGSAAGLSATVGELSSPGATSFDGCYPWRNITEVTDALGNVFIRIPKFYIRKTAAGAARTIEVSGFKHDGFYLPAVFYDFANSCELPYFDYGKHLGSLNGGVLASVPAVFPLVSKNIAEFRAYAQANGAGYQQLDVHAHDVLSALFTVEFATLNSQAILAGHTTGQYSATHVATATEAAANRIIVANAHADLFRAGQTIDIGTSLGGRQVAMNRLITSIDVVDASNKAISFDGAAVTVTAGNIVYNVARKCGFAAGVKSGYLTANDGKYPCSYRGIESPWGDIGQLVDGVNINEYQAWVCDDASQYASNVFAAPYVQLGYVNGNADGYITALGHDATHPFVELPTAAGGAATKYFADYYYGAAGQRIALVGGPWSHGPYAGLRYWDLYSPSSNANVRVGGRLLRKAL